MEFSIGLLDFLIILSIYLLIFIFTYYLFLLILSIYLPSGAGSLLLCGLFSSGREQGLLASCGVWTSHVVASLVVQEKLQALEHMAVVVMHGLTCSVACGIFPDQG